MELRQKFEFRIVIGGTRNIHDLRPGPGPRWESVTRRGFSCHRISGPRLGVVGSHCHRVKECLHSVGILESQLSHGPIGQARWEAHPAATFQFKSCNSCLSDAQKASRESSRKGSNFQPPNNGQFRINGCQNCGSIVSTPISTLLIELATVALQSAKSRFR